MKTLASQCECWVFTPLFFFLFCYFPSPFCQGGKSTRNFDSSYKLFFCSVFEYHSFVQRKKTRLMLICVVHSPSGVQAFPKNKNFPDPSCSVLFFFHKKLYNKPLVDKEWVHEKASHVIGFRTVLEWCPTVGTGWDAKREMLWSPPALLSRQSCT